MHVLIRGHAGTVCLPDPQLTMIDRADGGQLVVNPPRPVWDRTALTLDELVEWNLLVAATAAAMLDALPQLDGGCINYWDAGNWALHPDAAPIGPKRAREYRSLHLHLLGRSPLSRDPSWVWGEAPYFPPFSERYTWCRDKDPLTPDECRAVVSRIGEALRGDYQRHDALGMHWVVCAECAYPTPRADSVVCPTCLARRPQ